MSRYAGNCYVIAAQWTFLVYVYNWARNTLFLKRCVCVFFFLNLVLLLYFFFCTNLYRVEIHMRLCAPTYKTTPNKIKWFDLIICGYDGYENVLLFFCNCYCYCCCCCCFYYRRQFVADLGGWAVFMNGIFVFWMKTATIVVPVAANH